MSEQIRKNDEHWKDNLIGCTFDKKLEAAIAQRHNQELAADRLESRFKEYKRTGIAASQNIAEGSFVTAATPEGKILDVGFNCPDDLILDNFGVFFASLVRQPSTATASFSLTDIANSAQSFMIYSTTPASGLTQYFGYSQASTVGTQIQLGSGTTAAARANYAIETALGTAPENTRFATNAGGYGGGSFSFSGAISAGGSGTVNEMGFFGYWINTAGALKTVMLFHDILSSGVAFVAGNTLNASYSVTI